MEEKNKEGYQIFKQFQVDGYLLTKWSIKNQVNLNELDLYLYKSKTKNKNKNLEKRVKKNKEI